MVADILRRRTMSKVPNYYLPPFDQNRPGVQYASQATLAPSTFPTTIKIIQDGAIAGGVPTQSYGQVFRPGDIPVGHAPLFKVRGVTWSYSHGLQTYWPDGSLKWFAYALMVPAGFTLARRASVTVTISDGGAGTWPTASRRTLAEVYAQGLVVNGKTPTSPVTNNGRATDLVAALNGDSNQYYAVKDMDGGAGARWTIKTKMAPTVGGTPDAELVVTHRIFALSNASGGLGGFRWFGEIRNPFYATGAKTYIAFQPPSPANPSTGLNWQTVGPRGSGTVYNPVRLPFNPISYANGASFNGTVTGNILTVNSINFGLLAVGTTVTASYDRSVSTYVTISGSTTPTTVIVGGPLTVLVLPDGTGTTINLQISSSEPNGSIGGRGVYAINTQPRISSFKNTAILVSNPLDQSNNASAPGLHDGHTLTGQYRIQYQLTTADGDAPGLRGNYLLSGSVTGTIGPEAMTYWSNRNLISTVQNDFWSGGQAGNIVPGVVTGASLPPVSGGIPAGNPVTGRNHSLGFFIGAGFTPFISPYATTSNTSPIEFSGAGAGTFTPLPGLAPYTRFQIATEDGKYNFFQGTGSIAAETTLRVQINQAYWQSTGTFLPMDMSLIGVIPDTQYDWDWNPYNVGSVRTAAIDDYGPPIEVGPMCTFCGWDFYVQSARTEKENRIFGLSGGTLCCDFKNNNASTFDRLPPMNGPGLSYTGLPASLAGTDINPPSIGGAYGSPPGIVGSGLSDPTHEPDIGYWAYLRFGELQYFDYMVEWANCVTAYQQWGGGAAPSPPFPYLTYGNVMAQGQYRGSGWAHRDIQKVAFVCSRDPTNATGNPVFNDGSQLQQYLVDHADDNCRFPVAQLAADSASIYGLQAAADWAKATGCWMLNINSAPGGMTEMQEWERAYCGTGMILAVLRGNADARSWLATMMSWWDYVGRRSTVWKGNSANGYIHLYTISGKSNYQAVGTYNAGNGNPGITQDSAYAGAVVFFTNSSLTWAPNTGGGNAFVLNGNPKPAWNTDIPYVLSNGDRFCAYAVAGGNTLPVVPNAVPSALAQNAAYFIRDLKQTGPTTWTFNLTPIASGPNGPAVTITDKCIGPGMDFADRLISANPSIDDSNGPGYICQVANTVNWLHAIASNAKTNAIARFS